jgi:hypothetical protein
MTPQSTAAVAGRDRTVPPDARHRHTSACFWDVDECRWQCVTYPGIRCTPERRPTIGRLVTHTGWEITP